MWNQVCDPLGNAALSTLVAAVPIAVLLGTLGFLNMKAHYAAQPKRLWLSTTRGGSDVAEARGAVRKAAPPVLMAAANSSGGVMGKMIDAQSIVVASTATRWYGHEGDILRYVFLHSLALACLVGILVFLQAYVWPFSAMQLHIGG
jgi:L-lactate permease